MGKHDGTGEKWGFWKFDRRAEVGVGNGSEPESEEISEERKAEAERWEAAMGAEDTPEFAGEWGYGEQDESSEGEETEAAQETDEEETVEDELADVRKITSYGFDTASRRYGLETVINTIMETDEIVGNAENPLGVIYRALIPSAEERAELYREIRKDNDRVAKYNNEEAGREGEVLGFNPTGDFYDKSMKQPGGEQKSVEAIRAVRKLMNTLENDERFDALREKAYEQDQSIIECLMEGTDRPTISQFLDNIGALGGDGAEVSEGMVDEVLEEIEEKGEEVEGGSEGENEVGAEEEQVS